MKTRLRWAIHNMIGHPLMALATLANMPTLASWFHDVTLPQWGKEEEDEDDG